MPKRTLPPKAYRSGKEAKEARQASATRNIDSHVIPFTDHSSKSARMVFRTPEDITLPPILGFPFYFTKVDVPGDDVSSCYFHGHIFGNTEAPAYPVRLDLYFLPGASLEDCIEHYRAERESRDDFVAQIDIGKADPLEVRRRKKKGRARLPGVPPSYRDESDPEDVYDGMLYLCEEPTWRPSNWALRCVQFDVNELALEKLRESTGPETVVNPTREFAVVIKRRVEGQVMVDEMLAKTAGVQSEQNGWYAAWNSAAYTHHWRSW